MSLPVIAGIEFFALAVAWAPPAQATLGKSVESIEADCNALSGVTRNTETRPGYSVQEIQSDGTTIREFISPSGTIFGIAWVGLTHPDLTQLLGPYLPEYQKRARRQAHVPGRRMQTVRTSRIVVEKWGHMRKLQGRAYVPSLLPPGISPDEIK